MHTVSIIIVNWNTKELLQDCIKSVPDGAGNISFKIIVVDNASSDGSAKTVEEKFPDVVLIKNNDNKGFAYACNQGATVATGTYLFFLNPDTLLEKGCLQNLVEFADKQAWMGAVGPQLIGRDGKIQNSVRSFPRPRDVLIRDTFLKKIIPVSKKKKFLVKLSQKEASSVEQVSGAAFLIRRDLWKDIGGMDERFFMFYEEVDLCKRLKDLGYGIYYLPSARIVHRGGGSRRQDRSAVFYYSIKSMFAYLHKYESPGKMFWFNLIYKPLFLLSLLTAVKNKEKRDFLKKCLIEFIKF
jgi:GT2 family glycosyltransferase